VRDANESRQVRTTTRQFIAHWQTSRACWRLSRCSRSKQIASPMFRVRACFDTVHVHMRRGSKLCFMPNQRPGWCRSDAVSTNTLVTQQFCFSIVVALQAANNVQNLKHAARLQMFGVRTGSSGCVTAFLDSNAIISVIRTY
jgi:hypothetical protein